MIGSIISILIIMLEFFKRNRIFFLSILLSITLIIIDQITKSAAITNVNNLMHKTNGIHEYFNILPFLNIVLVFNRGISFGIFNSSSFMPTLLLFAILSIILYAFYMLCKSNSIYRSMYLGMILGGAIGNVIDRFRYGAVVDFIDFHISNWHFPAFNFADAVISLSVIFIIVEEFILLDKKADK